MIPADAHYCPACGDPLQDANVEFWADELLNRYRIPFRCTECGYHGEIIRHSSADKQPDAPSGGVGLGKEADE